MNFFTTPNSKNLIATLYIPPYITFPWSNPSSETYRPKPFIRCSLFHLTVQIIFAFWVPHFFTVLNIGLSQFLTNLLSSAIEPTSHCLFFVHGK